MRVRRAIILIAALSLGSCALLAAGWFFLLPLVFPQQDIGPRLAVIDTAIAGGYLSTARADVLAIRAVPRNEREALGLLKRAFILSREAGDYRLLAVMSDRALASGARSPSVRLVASYAYLRTERLSDAEAAARVGLPAGAGDMMRGEISLKRGVDWQGLDSLTRGLLALETSHRASDFISAARGVDDKRVSVDAALLLLAKGDLAQARAVAASSLQEATFDEPASMIAYDSGDFETAIARLTRLQSRRGPRADITLLLADCFHSLGRSAEYQGALQEAVRLDPRISWTPYADLGLVAQQEGNISLSRNVLANGRALFPGSRELVLATARLEAGAGNPAIALSLLDGLVAQRPDDAEAALMRLDLMAPGMTAQAYRVELWKLFDRLPADQRVFLTLASALTASHDWEGAGIAVHQHEVAQGAQDADTLIIRALAQTMLGKEDQAMGSLEQAAAVGGNAIAMYRYDLAALLLHKGSAQEALTQLDQAKGEASGASGGGDSRTAARIETLRGRCLIATGDIGAARSAFLRARMLDPHALRPGLELRKLEAQGVQ